MHHLVGNVQVWCGDGPLQHEAQPVQRHLFGAARNTPGSSEAVNAVRPQYLLGSSRGVGFRLVRSPHVTDTARMGAWELANRLNGWVEALAEPAHRTPGELDRLLISVLGS
ncbi:hypothetical protein [Streptomyces sp. NPDC050422]|uniref:hypothetical protein n=1 Tax=Streptomyces sp. NPDC050422 TaxID=3365614 RepID=UPI0037BDC6C5